MACKNLPASLGLGLKPKHECVVTKAEKPGPSLSPGSLLPSPATTTTAATAGKKPLQRKGMWTAEEEKYARELIRAFQGGWVEIPDGTFLRTFLSQRPNCSPMRISQKSLAQAGKQCFRTASAVAPTPRFASSCSCRTAPPCCIVLHNSGPRKFQAEHEKPGLKCAAHPASCTCAHIDVPVSGVVKARKRPRTAARAECYKARRTTPRVWLGCA
jgi:hypothetical protein